MRLKSSSWLPVISDRLPQLLFGIVLLASLCTIPLAHAAQTASSPPQEYTLGVFPFLAKPTLEGIFAPITVELSGALGRRVRMQSASSFEVFTENLKQQQYDIAHIHPFDYVITGKKSGYIPLATRTEMLKAVLAVKDESAIKTPRDLKGKTIGFPPTVASVSYLAKIALAESGLKAGKDVKIEHFATHQSCLQQLLIGNIDACACGEAVLRVFEEQSKKNLRVVLTSPQVPPTLFVVHRRVPAAEQEILRKTLYTSELSGVEPKLRSLFIKGTAVQGQGGYFRSIEDKEFDNIRRYLKQLEKEG